MSSRPPGTPTPTAASRRPRPGSPLLFSNALDASGRHGANLATDVLAVATLGATAAQMGLLNALGSMAFLVLGIPIGVVVDRSPTTRLLLGSGLVRAALLATVFVAWSLDALTLPHLYAVAALAGTATVVTETTQTAIVPRVVGPSGVSRLVSRLQSAESVVGLVVPALAGVLVALTGAGATLAVAAALVAAAALAVLRLRLRDHGSAGAAPDEAPSPTGALKGLFREAGLGWVTLRGNRALWRLTVGAMLINLGLAVHSAIEVVLVLRTLELGATTLGLLVSAGALGGLIGSLLAVPLGTRLGVARVMRGSVLMLAPVAALTLAALLDIERARTWLLLSTFLWGVAMVGYNVLNAGLAARITPTHLLGRVSATRRTLTMGVVPIGSVAGGLLADYAGMAAAVIAWIAFNAIGALVVLLAPLRDAAGDQSRDRT